MQNGDEERGEENKMQKGRKVKWTGQRKNNRKMNK